jgi:IS5 family transposase
LTRRLGEWAACRLIGDLEETIGATRRLLPQTDQRLQPGEPRRLVSLTDPDARPIRKGKPQHPPQFGYTLLLVEDERGFIADHQLQQGNPPDAPQLVPAVGRVITITGKAPSTVVGDRGFGTAANDQAVEALGVTRVGLQRTGTPGKARLALERPGPSGGSATGESGPEARISHLKRAFRLLRTRLRRLGVPAPGRTGVLHLQRAAHDRAGRMTRTSATDLAASAPHPHPCHHFFRGK